MATRTGKQRRESDREERGTRTALRRRHLPFAGIALAPLAALPLAWLIHVWAVGVDLHVGSHRWHVTGNQPALVVTCCLISIGAIGLAYQAWHFADHRKTPFRTSLAGSTAAIAFLFAISVGVGPHRWWSGVFVLVGWYVAAMWSLARLDVTRRDPREPAEEKPDGLMDRLGLTKWGFKTRDVVHDRDGNIERVEVDAIHEPGDTIDKLQTAVPAFESVTGAPAGMSRAVATDRADRSAMTLILRDPLKGRVPYGPPSHPGGSIADPINFALYDDGRPVFVFLAAGKSMPSSTSYGVMGMTRSGKTVGENEMMTEIESRRDAVVCYFNKAKGLQDVRSIIPGVEVAVISTDGSDGVAEYRDGLGKIERIMTYRQAQLARFGVSSWRPSCYSNPPSRRRADGTVERMEPMPALIVHVGEADAILEASGEQAVYIASKGLSLGIISGWSLQRADYQSMPTNLRFNIGMWMCFGVGDDISATFALTDAVVKAGAHPENWGQRKPGNFYVMGPGIDEANFAKRAKTYSLVGDDGDLSHEVLDELLQAEMLRRNSENAPMMAKLDRGSARATGAPNEPSNWWDLMAAKTGRIRNDLLGATTNMTDSDRNAGQVADPQPAPQRRKTFDLDAPVAAGQTPDRMEVADEVREVRNVEGVDLYDDPEDQDGPLDAENADDDLPMPPPGGFGDDEVTFEDDRPAPTSRGHAVEALHEVLRQLIDVEALRDPADPSGNSVIIQTNDIVIRYPYRSRPWFAQELAAMAEGKRTPPPALSLERVGGTHARDVRYRLSRVPDDDTA